MTAPKADLHIHTSYSNEDAFSMEEIVEEAQSIGVKVLSFTDYNTVAYYKERRINRYQYIGDTLVICGVELMCQGFWEVLGYCFDPDGPINTLLGTWHENLESLLCRDLSGISLTGGLDLAQIRLDFNRYDTGILSGSVGSFLKQTWNEAESYRPSVKDAIEIIRASQGLSFLAHPISVWDLVFRKDYSAMREYLLQLRELGLDGLEVYQPRLCKKDEEVQRFLGWLESIAAELDFLVSGGSDFHYRMIPYSQWAGEYSGILASTYDKLYWIEEVMSDVEDRCTRLDRSLDSLARVLRYEGPVRPTVH